MKTKEIVLIVLMAAAAVLVADPSVAEGENTGDSDACVKASTDPPGAVVDPSCVTTDPEGEATSEP